MFELVLRRRTRTAVALGWGLPTHAAHRNGDGSEMKKLVIQSLILLVVNIAIGGLIVASIYCVWFRRDPILGAVPAIIALPGILLQPWFIALSLLLPGPLIFVAPYWTTAVSVPVYVLLDRKGKLERVKGLLARIKTRSMVVMTSAIGALLLLVVVARYVDFPAMNRGMPETLQRALEEVDLELGSPRYYCIGSSFLDSEWIWQARISESKMNTLVVKLRLRSIPLDQIEDQYLSMSPYWWRPVISEQVYAFSTRDFPMDCMAPAAGMS